MKIDYIACQMTPEGLDEVQRFILAHSLNQNVASCGPPGVGKTELVENLIRVIANKLFDLTCDEKMTESPLIGYPILEGNGGVKSSYVNGVVTNALEQGGVLYLDEFNKLDGSLQKRCNSVFDDRKRITRRDGKVVTAQDGFFAVISYNPSEFGRADLEDSVADRFVNYFFDYLPEEIEAGIALRKADQTVDFNGTETRGLIYDKGMLRFVKKNKDRFVDFFTGDAVKEGKIMEYEAVKTKTKNGKEKELDLSELAEKMARFNSVVRSFSEFGTTQLDEQVKSNLTQLGETTKVKLHKPSPRTLQYSISQAKLLNELGLDAESAKRYATRLAIDQICYGSYKNKLVTADITTYEAVVKIAESQGLLPKKDQRSTFE